MQAALSKVSTPTVYTVLFSFLCYLSSLTNGKLQAQNVPVNHYHLEVGSLLSTDQTPFWLRANQYGIVPLKGPVVRLQGGVRADYRAADSTGRRPKVDWG